MNPIIFHLHYHAAKISGEEKSCKNKRRFNQEDYATLAAQHHNQWEERRNDVESYPCPFCYGWHIGRKMPISYLVKLWLTRKAK